MMYSDDLIRDVLTRVKTIAVVGFSNKPARASHGVARFLQSRGYRVVPVNPGLEGQTHLGETVYAGLAEIPFDVDMVDIFRRSDAVAGIVEAALARWPDLDVIWTQLDVRDDAAAQKAQARGVTVIQDRCPAIEIPRLRLG
ncbi:MAG: CoA-binding protein [Thalassobium sp.]|uniref:CoA-binding protein n=1 Tax=Octadecabacter sp. SW4 TaxID=2602067 RepID=UPI000C105465|nr:CoA-binding protein [Octadecabacter sp. SW4]PHQ85527.1 MAG: CoA-binding protein [Thalassobium sp.]QEE35145.1 CoA-binding protein [Octadecabacter sp. SW4]